MGAVGAELLAPQPPSGCITADLDGRAIPRFQVCPGCIEAYARVHTPSQFRSNFREADMSAAWKVDAIHNVITEATVKDRQRCDGRELRRQADDNAPCLLATEILPAQMIQKHAGRLPC
jgi:hypothetical protein